MEAEITGPKKQFWWQKGEEAKTTCARRPRPGHLCPECGQERLAYNGLFILTCPHCDYVAESGVFS